jgi:predicted RNA binding protein YcfA (HicA-like mRNA interferase family)
MTCVAPARPTAEGCDEPIPSLPLGWFPKLVRVNGQYKAERVSPEEAQIATQRMVESLPIAAGPKVAWGLGKVVVGFFAKLFGGKAVVALGTQMTSIEATRKLQKSGWTLLRQKGSHMQFAREAERLTVPNHPGKSLAIGIVKQIEKALIK